MKKQVNSRVAAMKRDGRTFAEFRSIEEAARILQVSPESIKQVMAGKKKSVLGIIFREIDSENEHILSGSC